MASRTEKLKRRKHRKEKKQRKRGGPVAPSHRASDLVIYHDILPVRMSEVLLDLIAPEQEYCKDEAALEKLLTIGAAAWNASLMGGAEQRAILEETSRTLPADARQDYFEIVETLIRRKRQMFPDIKRPIIDFKLTLLPTGEPHLSVISGLVEVK